MQHSKRITDLVPAAKRDEGARATLITLLVTIDARRQSLAIENRHRLQTIDLRFFQLYQLPRNSGNLHASWES